MFYPSRNPLKMLDHYLIRILISYKRLDRILKLYGGPVSQASSTAAIIPTGYFVLLTIIFKLWGNLYLQFISTTLAVGIFIFLSLYFEKRLKRIIYPFNKETNTERYISIFLVNSFIAFSYFLFLYIFLKKIG